ncbi:hybrid sensor histidine kinase/response regulator [Geothrix limicola]|nr:PAS domain-containing sensor histidine kinase [Geothrix limicola]
MAKDLRLRAEALFHAHWTASPEDVEAMTADDRRQLVHELRVHQIELEMQNEELRLTQAKLDASQARYFDLYNRAPLGYLTIDEGGLIQEANLTAATILGADRGAMVQQPITRFILDEDQDEYYLYRKQIFETREPRSCELRMMRQDGTSFWAHLEACVVTADDGCTLSRLVLSDITERQRLEKEQEHLRLQVQRSRNMETLGRLAGGVAHDMNNVLAAILGLASANLELQPKGSTAYLAFETICKAAVRGGNTVKSLLTFAHQRPAEEQDIELNVILREEVRLLERTTLSKIHLEMDLDPALGLIRGDASALTHAFMNLCVNAVDAMAQNGTLSLRTRNLGEHWVQVIIEDTGCGMSKEIQAKALDPFFTTKEVGKGTGLGLSMVYSAVEAHRGHMAIESELDRGTRVEMSFPRCDVQVKPMQPLIEPYLGQPQPVLDVVVVDDDELIHSAMKTLLQALGHRVTVASSGEEALAQLESGANPDVVILDMNMPGLGGLGTLPQLHAMRPKMPVLISTGRVDQSTLDLIAAHPYTSLIPKPFSLDQLRKRLEPMLSKETFGALPSRSRRTSAERRRAESTFQVGAQIHSATKGYLGTERRNGFNTDRRRL